MNRTGIKCIPLLLVIIAVFICSCSSKPNNKIPIIADKQPVIENENNDSIRIIKGVFDIPEITVLPSPDLAVSVSIPAGEKVVDYAVSPLGLTVAILVEKPGEKYTLRFWHMGQKQFSDSCAFPTGYTVTETAWHPEATAIFAIGQRQGNYHILKIRKGTKGWDVKDIYAASGQLKNLVVCPRPFIISYKNENGQYREYFSYRLFSGMSNTDNSYRIVSITETGTRFYQVIGPEKTITHIAEGEDPSSIKAGWALPVAFHPSGHELIWEDAKNNFYAANYANKFWDKSTPMNLNAVKSGSITPTPNGLGLLHWQSGKPGIGLYLLSTRKEAEQVPECNFSQMPCPVPDGKGIVGLIQSNTQYLLKYIPIHIPLADVVNAWMYSTTPEEEELFQQNKGLFRTTGYDQLYTLYETENYYCGDYDRNSPTRPYLVTTDIFWELFGAAYQGLFIVKERDEAIPSFWKFINEACAYYKKSDPVSRWVPVFEILVNLHSEENKSPEVIRICNARDAYSDLLQRDYSYSELKPRGHYTSSIEMQKYFMAFRYLTTVYSKDRKVQEELNALPSEIKEYAVQWIQSYRGFIAPSRSKLVWSNYKNVFPPYLQYPGKDLSIFPLSWGFDNEVLYSTVYHQDVPFEKQIADINGNPRMLPSGLDLADVLGNHLAETLIAPEYGKYPRLKNVTGQLKNNFRSNGRAAEKESLYDKWIDALAIQWADSATGPANKSINQALWKVKRLQTGLASWATLRHASLLVNERTVAECGEGGFEEIILRAPRGYVEPDPHTFGAIAGLFEAALRYVSESTHRNENIHESYEKVEGSLYEGIVRRLQETAHDARLFQSIAQKEIKGEAITNEEYERMLYIGGVAEHNFLVFNSLANKEYALSTPDPMAKIADVAGDGPYLMAAVGNALEWDCIVPFFGRHQLVKGSVYSYYEFTSSELLSDEEWREKAKTQKHVPWVMPYITEQKVSYPATTGY